MQEALLPRVQTAFQRAFDLDPRSITLDTQPADVAKWDSLGHATLAFSLEREFNIRFDIDELMALEDVRAIVRVVGLKLGPGGHT
jgi:acyl carrier protein